MGVGSSGLFGETGVRKINGPTVEKGRVVFTLPVAEVLINYIFQLRVCSNNPVAMFFKNTLCKLIKIVN